MKIDVMLTPADLAAAPQAELARSVCVVLDILRASSSIVTALAHGARRVLPAASVAEARRLKRSFPGALLAGEKNGLKIPGFELGNPPSEFSRSAVGGREVIMATTNGTRAIRACAGAEKTYVGAFLNLSAVVREAAPFLKSSGLDLKIVCSGTQEDFSWEDSVAAGAFAQAFRRRLARADFGDSALAALSLYLAEGKRLQASLGQGRNGRRLKSLGLARDIARCAQVDRYGLAAGVGEAAGFVSVEG